MQLAESGGFGKCDTRFFDALWQGVTGEFDTLLAAFAPYLDRAPEQLSPIEKAVLAIGTWELLRAPDIPYRVAINEAVELAKAYGGTDGHKYVNGVLDKLATTIRAAETTAPRIAT
jgi:N utilization substance protein B